MFWGDFADKNKKGLQGRKLSWQAYFELYKSRRKPCISSISQEIAYHQCGALYIIITEFLYTLKRDDMQKRAIFSLFLMICTQTSCVMIYHYSVMDKKKTAILYQYCSLFLARREGFEPPETLASTVFKKLTAFPISSLTLPNR